MIRRITLKNWRAYDELDLSLDQGATFIVARNGIGKTSLMQAVAFALYGQEALRNPMSAVRVGRQSARVEVTVELPDGRSLRIARTVGRRQTGVHAWLNDEPLGADGNLGALLASSLGADLGFLAKSTIVQEGTVQQEAESSFSLYQHLCAVYGIDNLLAASDELTQLRKAAERSVKSATQSMGRTQRELEELLDRVEAARAAAGQADAELQRAQASFDTAEDAHLRASVRERWEADAAKRKHLLDGLLRDAASLIGRHVAVDDLQVVLDQVEAGAQEAIDHIRRRRAEATGRIKAMQSSLRLLSSTDGECPVCRRPLSGAEAVTARTQHEQEIATIEAEAAGLDDRPQLERVEAARSLRRRLSAVPVETDAPAKVDADVAQTLADARARLQAAKREAVLLHEELDVLTEQLEQARRDSGRRRELEIAYRREALVMATTEAVRQAAEHVIGDSLRPLADEIAWRWKRMFGDRGILQLRPDGTVVLRRGEHEVPFHDFSAGERMIAVLLVRMTVLAVSTKARFFWVDEPLEHLDPTYRLVVGSMLAQASTSHALRQVVVTTYEERIAEQIAAYSDDASVQFVTAGMP